MTTDRDPALADLLAQHGLQACTCPYEWKGLGTLYRISMGKGWVRLVDAANCPEHGCELPRAWGGEARSENRKNSASAMAYPTSQKAPNDSP